MAYFAVQLASYVGIGLKQHDEMKDSIVGDPIFWPGLVYSPINLNGLLFALGTVTDDIGLLFEEFSSEDNVAICRRKTTSGWARIEAALSLKSSEFKPRENQPDLLICWINDAGLDGEEMPVLELSNVKGKVPTVPASPKAVKAGLDQIFREDPSESLRDRGESIFDFEETIRQLDERIKKLKNE